ncbi:MAG: bifunctional sugar-binding transcriptional regulator/dihydroxyacetone kinase subunit DhaK [Rhodobacteraceae bacterium]|nr:bifunctional sugar-binding transcriptional regulator/dihydroxyacetone kinase subunit DhaK [Paracoccaceae bacterium]
MPHPKKRTAKDTQSPKPPLRFGEDPLLWVSWLYYEEGLTQGEIARIVGASRPTVNAYLAEARTKGIVSIAISYEKLRSTTLSSALTERFGLDDCLIIPGEGGDRALIDRLGSATAQALPRVLHSGDTIAITWGRTMLSVADAAKDLHLRDATVVQATGGTTATIPYTPEACATRLADSIGARFVPISAPAIVSSPEARRILEQEPVVSEQLQMLGQVNRILFGLSSLRPTSTIHSSGFFEGSIQQQAQYGQAIGSLAGRFIDGTGAIIEGPLGDRTIGIGLDALRAIETRILVSGGYDKVPPMLAALRGNYVTVLVTDAATGEGILRADGLELDSPRPHLKETAPMVTPVRGRRKQFINRTKNAVDEALEGALMAYPGHIEKIGDTVRAIRAVAQKPPGKVGIVIGGGAGHEPSFLGFVGRGLPDAVAVGNVFASPPPDRVLACARDADDGAGVLFIYGNYTGDIMNFDMAAELAEANGITVRSIQTTDDIASVSDNDRAAGRGIAGSIFVFKISGAASARLYSLDECERIARKANASCYTIGVALEPGSSPETQRPSFQLGEADMEFGVGVHGEPGALRQPMTSADRIVDQICDRLFEEMALNEGDRIAVLVNSFGGTPMMELFILNRRLNQRLAKRNITVHKSLVGNFFTSLDMVGASVTLLKLDEELTGLLDDSCEGFAYSQ